MVQFKSKSWEDICVCNKWYEEAVNDLLFPNGIFLTVDSSEQNFDIDHVYFTTVSYILFQQLQKSLYHLCCIQGSKFAQFPTLYFL